MVSMLLLFTSKIHPGGEGGQLVAQWQHSHLKTSSLKIEIEGGYEITFQRDWIRENSGCNQYHIHATSKNKGLFFASKNLCREDDCQAFVGNVISTFKKVGLIFSSPRQENKEELEPRLKQWVEEWSENNFYDFDQIKIENLESQTAGHSHLLFSRGNQNTQTLNICTPWTGKDQLIFASNAEMKFES